MDTAAGASSKGTRWVGVDSAGTVRQTIHRRIVEAAKRAIERRGAFLMVLAGGNTPYDLYQMLRAMNTDWSCWHMYFGDERCLPVKSPERNSRMVAEAWLDHVPIPPGQVHVIRAELGADAAAHSYADLLRDTGDFDLVLLGLGEDGHTASLFPGHDWGVAADAPDALAVYGAPKPPSQRISLSAARLSRAREVLFMVEGESKRTAVARWQAGDPLVPAAAIRPAAGVDVVLKASLLKPSVF